MSVQPTQQTFAIAYREHLGWMLHTVRRLGVQAPDAEDVAHDVFSTAWRRLDTWVPERPMRPWLFGIAFRVVSNRKSTRAGNEELSDTLDQLEGSPHRPDELLEGEVTRQHVLRALDALPIDQRAVFVGHDIESTPITELATSLEIPLNTAYSRLRLARQRFQSTFSGLQNEVRA
jgi:RNA polymerase sigma-70 factor (ECF subfamily)